ncbi:MAG: YHS domain-containing protein [Nitrospinota bacterium]|nr:MAG: YHS domain-containing protein [Nitrospinota bacterium]
MIRYIFLLAIGYLVYTLLKGVFRSSPPSPPGGEETPVEDEMVKDPVCDTYIPRSMAITKTRGGVVYYFCSQKCAEEFSRHQT